MKLILLPGMDGSGRLFEPLREAFSRHPAAMGRVQLQVLSYPAAAILGYAELEAQVRAALPPDQPFILVGESFSGPVAVSLAAHLLEVGDTRLKGLVLCCSFVRSPRSVPVSVATCLSRWFPVNHVSRALLSPLLLGRWTNRSLRHLLHAALAPLTPAVLSHRIRAVLTVNVADQLARCASNAQPLPLLYLQAGDDRLVPPAALKVIQQSAPSIAVVKLNGPHCLLQTQPVPACAALVDFMQINGIA